MYQSFFKIKYTILSRHKFRNVQINMRVWSRRTTSNIWCPSNPHKQIYVMAAVIYHPLETKHFVNGVKHWYFVF